MELIKYVGKMVVLITAAYYEFWVMGWLI